MATPDQIPTDLTLALGDDLGPEEFVAAVRNFFGYINAVASRKVVGLFSEQLWLQFVPALQRLQGRLAAQG